MTAAIALRAGRRAAEMLMTDSCTIRRAEPAVVDPTTNRLLPAVTVVYTGRCRLRSQSTQTQSRESESQLLVASQFILSLPYDAAADLRVDDVAETTTGVTVRIVGTVAQTYATARRLPVEVLT